MLTKSKFLKTKRICATSASKKGQNSQRQVLESTSRKVIVYRNLRGNIKLTAETSFAKSNDDFQKAEKPTGQLLLKR